MIQSLMMHTGRWFGYALSFGGGLILWPRLIEIGFRHENTNFFLAITLVWGCLPVSMGITWVGSIVYMKAIHIADRFNRAVIDRSIQTAALLGIVGTLGSCGMIASGYEPPEPFHSIYDLDLSGKHR